MGVSGADIGFAFALVVGAGLCCPLGTYLGIKLGGDRYGKLSLCLALAAGVLIWVALVGLHPEAYESFEHGAAKTWPKKHGSGGHDHAHRRLLTPFSWLDTSSAASIFSREGRAFGPDPEDEHEEEEEEEEDEEVKKSMAWAPRTFTLLCIIGGILLGQGIDLLLHRLGLGHGHGHGHDHGHGKKALQSTTNVEMGTGHVSGPSGKEDETPGDNSFLGLPNDTGHSIQYTTSESTHGRAPSSLSSGKRETLRELTKIERDELQSVSVATCLAVTLHNFPEGLATFASAVAEPHLGALVAVAVALHNLPLGVAVGMPIYAAQEQNMIRALLWSTCCGLSALFGACVGLIIVKSSGGLHTNTSGVMFGFVVGIMLWTAFRELIPQAREHDPSDRYTTYLIFIGFVVMDISLIIFDSQGGHEH